MLFDSAPIAVSALAVAALLGLVAGSFINCWAWRSTHGEPVTRGRFHCDECGHELGVRDLVPLFSWLAAKGACWYCGARVSARYPLTELVSAGAFVAITACYGISLETVELLLFACILLFLALIDLDEMVIPDGCIVAALAVRAAYLLGMAALGHDVAGEVAASFIGGLALGLGVFAAVLVADRVFGRESMGGGDLKLFAVAGFYFGWQQGLLLVLLSCIIGLAAALAGLRNEERQFPFGPSIAAACVAVMVVGGPLVSWYASAVM